MKIEKPIKLMFMDEMRYGLISNYLRSWSKKGIRTIVPNQLEYESSYLYSAISPIDGESFHLISIDTVNGNRIKIFIEELQKKYKDNHIDVATLIKTKNKSNFLLK